MNALTIEELAAHYKTPTEALTEAGCYQMESGVAFPVFHNDAEIGQHIRVSPGGDGRPLWRWQLPDRNRRTPFGAHRLAEMKASRDYPLLICEGEVDAAICQYLQFPAIASGGVNMWRPCWWDLIQQAGFQQVAVWVEPQGGEKLLADVFRSRPPDFPVIAVETLRHGEKDAGHLFKTLGENRTAEILQELLFYAKEGYWTAREISQADFAHALDGLLKPTHIGQDGNRQCLCPFHPDNTPSLSYHPERGFNCFGCGLRGSPPLLGALLGLVLEKPEEQARASVPTLVPTKGTPVGTELREATFADLQAESEGFEVEFLPLLGEGGLVPLGLSTILAGYPKVGKSTLLYQNVLAWAQAGKTILLFTEEERIPWKKRLSGSRAEGLERVRVVFSLGVPPAKLLQRAREGKEETILLDSTKLVGIEDENDAAKVNLTLGPWLQMAAERKATFLASHHTTKEQKADIRAVAGSYCFAALFDSVLFVRQDEHTRNRRLLDGLSRVSSVQPLLYELGVDGSLASLGSPDALEVGEVGRRALSLLEGEEWKITKDIFQGFGEPKPSEEQLRRALVRLAEENLIERDPPLSEGKRPGITHRWRLATSVPTGRGIVGTELQPPLQPALPSGGDGPSDREILAAFEQEQSAAVVSHLYGWPEAWLRKRLEPLVEEGCLRHKGNGRYAAVQ